MFSNNFLTENVDGKEKKQTGRWPLTSQFKESFLSFLELSSFFELFNFLISDNVSVSKIDEKLKKFN
jgi:hypothetical protein